MKLVVFGANGKVGTLVVKKALSEGHTVVAVVHGDSHLPTHDNLTVQKGDVYDATSVAKAIAGADTVISALGSWGTPKKDILTRGMEHIIPAMQSHKARRIVSLTGADAWAEGDDSSVFHSMTRKLLSIVAGKILRDGEEHIALLQKSDLDWTVVRSPVMNERGNAAYQLITTRPKPWQTIHREAVAETLLELAIAKANPYTHTAPFIHR